MWERRAHRSRQEIATLAGSGLGVTEFHAAAIAVVERHVGSDLVCWAALDPGTLSISTMTSGPTQLPAQFGPLLARSEYSAGQPHAWTTLARRGTTLAKLTEMSAADRARSLRFQTVWRPLGVNQELRVIFRTGGTPWAAAGLVRHGSDYSNRETEFLLAVAPAVAVGTMLAVRADAGGAASGLSPAVFVVSADGALRSATAAADTWRERLDDADPGRFELLTQMVVTGVRASADGQFRTRVLVGRGTWLSLNASALVGTDDGEVAVVIEPLSGDQLVGLLLMAYGLSAREREICQEVFAGRSTAAIADRLFITVGTVQDHLRSIFAKVSVRSRGELVARLRSAG